MKERICFPAALAFSLLLNGCSRSGAKAENFAGIYCTAAVIAGFIFLCYCLCFRKKERWFVLLFASVMIVNVGYFALSISANLNQALWANRLAYLGSVFLPMSMLMIILKVTRTQYPNYLAGVLIGIGFVVFLIAASPGYLKIYYQDVSFSINNGAGVLHKVYGPWHRVYHYYLMGYYSATLFVVIRAFIKKKMEAISHAVILAIAVSVNLGVWFLEQLVHIDFEILSISYIITELFLIGLNMIVHENEHLHAMIDKQVDLRRTTPQIKPAEIAVEVDPAQLAQNLKTLTKTESHIYQLYMEGKSTKEIMATLAIKENTLKFHNKNLYSKLGVSSRKHLQSLYLPVYNPKE